MRVAFTGLIGAALVLGGCARDPYVTTAGERAVGAWRITTQTDRIIGAPSTGIRTTALASNSYADFPKLAGMQISCFDGQPLVRLSFDFKIGSDKNTVLGYRVDDKPGRDNVPGVRFLQKEKMAVIEERKDVEQFINEMRGSHSVFIRIRSLTDGRTTVTFKLEGFDEAIGAAFGGCTLNLPATAYEPRRQLS